MTAIPPQIAQLRATLQQALHHHQAGRLAEAERLYRSILQVRYRANRAVIFDSDLFHETDRIAFKEGYLNRRINITMLYGKREAAARR
jgi:Family of unknown function (DUF6445)